MRCLRLTLPHTRGGYTLLEICFALCILAVILGTAMPNIYGWLKEERLRAPATELKLLARTARLAAIEHQQPYQVVILPNQMWIEPVNPPPQTTAPTSNSLFTDNSSTSNTSASAGKSTDNLPDRYNVPDSTGIFVQSWTDTQMNKVSEYDWKFQASGLCAPLSVKFTQDKGELELDFDPLTATVAKEKLYIP